MLTKANPVQHCEFKFASDGYAIEGYGSRFGLNDSYGDTVHPGAFEKTLQDRSRPILMRFEHMPHMYPGKWLEASEDEKGLKIIGELTKGHSLAEDARASMKHGVLSGLSIGFTIPKGGAKNKAEGGRDIHEVDLVEVSLTATPAEPEAQITSFKSELLTLETIRDCEDFLRESGMFSRSMAQAFVGQFKSVLQRDSESDDESRAMIGKANEDLHAILNRYKLNF